MKQPLLSSFIITSATTARAIFTVRATDATLTALFGVNDVRQSAAKYCEDNKDNNIIYYSHISPQFAPTRLASLLFLSMRATSVRANAPTIANPSTGIQNAPSSPPVMSVPKKYTRNPIEYPTPS